MKKQATPLRSIPAAFALAVVWFAAPAALAQDKPAVESAATSASVKESQAPAAPAERVQKPAEIPAGLIPAEDPASEAYLNRLKALRTPREKAVEQVRVATEKIEARKKALFAENEVAGKLVAEIEAMKQELEEKDAALTEILDADEALQKLNQELVAARESLRLAQRGMQDEIARRHLEHRRELERKAREAEEAKAREAEKAKADAAKKAN